MEYQYQLEDYIHKFDVLSRPYLIYCNPNDKQIIVDALGDSQVIEAIPWIESGKVLVLDRAKFEQQYMEWLNGMVDIREIGDG